MAADRDGLAPAAARDLRQPWFSSPAEMQADIIIGNIKRLCEGSGTSLENVVRLQQFHTDISEFYSVYKFCEHNLAGRPLPFSAVHRSGHVALPGSTLVTG